MTKKLGYIAKYGESGHAEFYADSLYDAKKKAVEWFKPPKSKAHLVNVMLVEKDGEPVIHLPLF